MHSELEHKLYDSIGSVLGWNLVMDLSFEDN
jgi:hypothetical protein